MAEPNLAQATQLQMPAGWVTPAQFKELTSRRAMESPAFERNVRVLNEASGGDWRKWPLHLQKDVFEKLGITAIVMPLGPGGALVSDCTDAELEPIAGGGTTVMKGPAA